MSDMRLVIRLQQSDTVLELSTGEPGSLVLEISSADPDDHMIGARFELDAKDFIAKLHLLVPEMQR